MRGDDEQGGDDDEESVGNKEARGRRKPLEGTDGEIERGIARSV